MNKVIGVLIVILVVFIIGFNGCLAYGTQDTATITVKKTIQKRSGETDRYLVFTEKHGVFENTDSFWLFKFNSSDVQGELGEGKTYDIRYYGWRIGFFSMYPNIIKVYREVS
jgi:hypothetical protein